MKRDDQKPETPSIQTPEKPASDTPEWLSYTDDGEEDSPSQITQVSHKQEPPASSIADTEKAAKDSRAAHKTSVLKRISDRSKLPKSWWFPVVAVDVPDLPALEKLHEQTSNTIQNTCMVLLGYCFFCWLTLGAPDISLISRGAKVKVPFANVDMEFVSFLFIGPAILIGLGFYLHMFVEYWHQLNLWASSHSYRNHMKITPFFFNIERTSPRMMRFFIFYALIPLTMAAFAWKSWPQPDSRLLFKSTGLVIVAAVFLKIRRCEGKVQGIRTIVAWLLRGGLLLLAFLLIAPPRGIGIYRPLNLYAAVLENKDLTSANLEGAKLQKANLRGANLQDANLEGANLQDANLGGANLRGAFLGRANLMGANLQKASLEGARLQEANLRGANLRGANLWEANLLRADLERAELKGAKLKGANFEGANFEGANFEGALDLTVVQLARSKTLYKAELPLNLLRKLQKQYPHLLKKKPKNEDPKYPEMSND